MKYEYRLLIILIFVHMVFLTLPAYGEGQKPPITVLSIMDTAGYKSSTLSLMEFYRGQAGILHSSIQKLLNNSGLNEFLLKQTVIATEFQEGHSAAALPSYLTFEKSSGSERIKPAAVTDSAKPTLYASVSENLRSPVLAPFKYKTTSNTLLSVMLPIPATDHLTIIPIVSYAFSIYGSDRSDLKIRSLLKEKEDPVFYGGINLIYSF